MCIIISSPNGKTIKENYLNNSNLNNGDGIGIMYSKNGILSIQKFFNNYAQFLHFYNTNIKNKNLPHSVHFRIATSGNIDVQNCHPFKVKENVFLMHNGILNSVNVPKKSVINDTQIFINTYLSQLPKNFYNNKHILNMIEKLIGNGNKFVLMSAEGKTIIINETAGHWENGIWFSNYSYSYGNEYLENDFIYSKPKNRKNKYFESVYSSNLDIYENCESCFASIPYYSLKYSKDFNCMLCKQCDLALN